MAWSKTKISIVTATVLLLPVVVVGTVKFFHWLRDPQRLALAEGQRDIDQHIAEPADVTAKIQTPASYFAKITQFPQWKAVPIGFQMFCHVPLQIDGMICLWGEGNAKMGLNFPESWTDIPMNQKFETLYVYHSSFFESKPGTPVYAIVFRYDDGSSATNQILYGDDVLDWMARRKVIVPGAARSKLAWHGDSAPGKSQQLCFFLTAVENPNPDLTVTTIDLYSCKSRTAPCILAFTPGKAGLMK